MSSAGPLICSQFDPTGSHLACGVVNLDAHLVIVKSVNASQGALNTLFSLDKTLRLTNITWIPYENQHILALCLSKGSTLLYSPHTNTIVGELGNPSKLPVSDFHFSIYTQSAWLCDNGGNICEWNMATLKLASSFKMGDMIENVEPATRILSIAHDGIPLLLIGSHSIHLVDANAQKVIRVFHGHVEPVKTLLPLSKFGHDNLFISCAASDRFINLYSVERASTKSVFVTESPVVQISVGAVNNHTVLLVLTENGTVEVFNDALSDNVKAPEPNAALSKRKRRQQAQTALSRASNASFKLGRPKDEINTPSDASLPVHAITNVQDSVVYSWLENASVPLFDRTPWLTADGEFALSGNKIILKSRTNVSAATHSTQGHDVAAPSLYNEANVTVTDGTNSNDIEDDDDDMETLADKLEKLEPDTKLSTHSTKRKNEARKSGTLTIVLSQSLKNNDHSLLETVLSNRDPHVIQHTISNLNPALAVILLDRLSERLQRQVNRFDQLNYWLRWIIIIHGAVLASMPNLSTKLSHLHSTLTKRASSLPRLLELQGRFGMLSEQSKLKREIISESLSSDEEEADSDVEYIEEIDDARIMGILDESDEDLEMNGQDDYAESEDEEIDSEDLQDGDSEEADNYSDQEADA